MTPTNALDHLALAVPLSRFTPRVGGGSTFFVRRHRRDDLIVGKCLKAKH